MPFGKTKVRRLRGACGAAPVPASFQVGNTWGLKMLTCLYSAAARLPRSLPAVAQRVASSPRCPSERARFPFEERSFLDPLSFFTDSLLPSLMPSFGGNDTRWV